VSPVGTLTRHRALAATLWLRWGVGEGGEVEWGSCFWCARKEKNASIGSLGQETQLGVLETPSMAIYTVRPVQYPYDIMGYKLP
jgi:hypothetical protein